MIAELEARKDRPDLTHVAFGLRRAGLPPFQKEDKKRGVDWLLEKGGNPTLCKRRAEHPNS